MGCDIPPKGSLQLPGGFNSRTPCGVRLIDSIDETHPAKVSIHAPRVGCDRHVRTPRSRSSVSIHAPRVGCDASYASWTAGQPRFNSRTPCGVRPPHPTALLIPQKFQFTHPVWGATAYLCGIQIDNAFQFTHPVWGATEKLRTQWCRYGGFNSRTPCGVRLGYYTAYAPHLSFNSRTPCGVRRGSTRSTSTTSRFQFTHPVWGATPFSLPGGCAWRCFNSRTPCGVRQGR